MRKFSITHMWSWCWPLSSPFKQGRFYKFPCHYHIFRIPAWGTQSIIFRTWCQKSKTWGSVVSNRSNFAFTFLY
jgi:hypothetical protein